MMFGCPCSKPRIATGTRTSNTGNPSRRRFAVLPWATGVGRSAGTPSGATRVARVRAVGLVPMLVPMAQSNWDGPAPGSPGPCALQHPMWLWWLSARGRGARSAEVGATVWKGGRISQAPGDLERPWMKASTPPPAAPPPDIAQRLQTRHGTTGRLVNPSTQASAPWVQTLGRGLGMPVSKL